MYLSLPLPIQKQRSIFVYMLRADPASLITKVWFGCVMTGAGVWFGCVMTGGCGLGVS